jgi:hypothetical protein
MGRFFISLFIIAFVSVFSGAQTQDSSRVQVKILWDYKDLPVGMKIYELKGKPPLWTTDSVKDEHQLPFGKEIEDSTFLLKPGLAKRFALGYKNTTDKPIYFFAAPHAAEPPENSLGFKFKCLCINHAYHLEPGETWYRIVEFKLSKVFSANQIALKHTLISISPEKAKSINSTPPIDSHFHD